MKKIRMRCGIPSISDQSTARCDKLGEDRPIFKLI